MDSVYRNISENGQYPTECMTWQSPVCSTKYMTIASLLNKIHLREQCPTEYTWQWTVACVQQIHDSCQCVQQNILAAASVFIKIWQLPVCPTKYTWQWTVACVQQIHDSCQYVQQNTPGSEQLPVSNKFMTVASVSNKIYWQLPVCSLKYMTVASMSNKIHLAVNSCLCLTNSWQLPVCPTKYTSLRRQRPKA